MQDKAKLLEDILSYRKSNKKDIIYGTKGEIVKIIAVHIHCMIIAIVF